MIKGNVLEQSRFKLLFQYLVSRQSEYAGEIDICRWCFSLINAIRQEKSTDSEVSELKLQTATKKNNPLNWSDVHV